MPKVTFTDTRAPNDGSGRVFAAGETYDLPTDSCERWIKRGAAKYADGSGPEKVMRQPVAPRPRLSDITVNVTEIPDEWRDLPWHDLLGLAKSFNEEVRTKDDAIAAIELEIERRKAE